MREITDVTIQELNEAAGREDEEVEITRGELETILGEGHIINMPGTSGKQWLLASNSTLRTDKKWFPKLQPRLAKKFDGGVFTGDRVVLPKSEEK